VSGKMSRLVGPRMMLAFRSRNSFRAATTCVGVAPKQIRVTRTMTHVDLLVLRDLSAQHPQGGAPER
jgi:hypothetical protein